MSREIRKKLWDENPFCYWCGIETTFSFNENGILQDNEATIEHLYSKLSPLRNTHLQRKFIACYKCNNGRASHAQKKQSQFERQSKNTEIKKFKFMNLKRV